MAKTKVHEVPYNHLGNLQHYPCSTWDYSQKDGNGRPRIYETDWRLNDPFEETLQFEQMQRGRSAAYSLWKDPEGHTYPMFMSDLEELLINKIIRNGVVRCTWIVKKRGSNYGIGLYKE